MFFVASKVLWFFAAPINFLLAIAFVGAILSRGRHGRGARAIAIGAMGLLLLAGVLPAGDWLIEPLEDRFPPPPANLAAPYGIIVLGGAIDPELDEARHQVILSDGAARLTETHPEPLRFRARALSGQGRVDGGRGAHRRR